MSTAIGVSLPRLATAVGKAISEYAVLGKTPGFTADFIKNKYPGYASFSSAITHARAGNATMTDGYGPELVVNGGFDSDSDWTKGAGWSIADGVASSDGSQSSSSALQAVNILTIGKTYVVTFTVVSRSAGSITARAGTNGVGTGRTATGTYTEIITCAGTDDLRMTASNDFVGSIDNVSVREMPVLKWGPHNLVQYSEDLSQLWTVDNGAVKSSTTEIDPNGGNTAALITNLQNVDNARINRNLAITEDSTFGVFLKGTAGETINIEHGTDQQTVTLTSDWKLHTVNVTAPQTTLRIINRAVCTADEVYFAFPHVFRSDLGGMVDNPERGDSYVPTTSSDKYLPRVGHHVYNGSAWVNEGVLAESEQRVNLWLYSNDPTNAAWSFANYVTRPTSASLAGPDGQTSGYSLIPTTSSNSHYVAQSFSLTSGNDYTLSFYLKENGYRYAQIIIGGAYSADDYANFDLQDGVIGDVSTAATATIQDVGNGWFRCSCTFPADATATGNSGIAFIQSLTDGRVPSFSADGTSGVYVYGAQLEQASTPSSYIPTSTQQEIREAESFTIPSANLPWPTPQYISDELVTDISPSAWTASGSNTVTQDVSGNTVITYVDSSSGADFLLTTANGGLTQNLVSGKLYEFSVTLDTGGDTIGLLRATSLTPNYNINVTTSGFETFTHIFMSDGSELFRVDSMGAGEVATISSVSVREINPLSVSIAMEGRMTYADEGENFQIKFLQWLEDGSNFIESSVTTASTTTGRMDFRQEVGGTNDFVSSGNTYFSPDILVPYNIASRHGSTFINGATDGVALTADTDPTRLPDLSSTDLNLAYDYMGTISEFRVWDKDIGDAGIVEATNPSLEPSLSLTFEGTGTNSFVVNNWSE